MTKRAQVDGASNRLIEQQRRRQQVGTNIEQSVMEETETEENGSRGYRSGRGDDK